MYRVNQTRGIWAVNQSVGMGFSSSSKMLPELREISKTHNFPFANQYLLEYGNKMDVLLLTIDDDRGGK